MKNLPVCAAMLALSLSSSAAPSGLERPADLDFRPPIERPLPLPPERAIFVVAQDEPPAVVPVFDFGFATNRRVYQVTRVEHAGKTYLGGALAASLFTGSGFDLQSGAPLVSPLGIGVVFELDLDFFVLQLKGGVDLIVVQAEKPAAWAYGSIGFKVPVGGR